MDFVNGFRMTSHKKKHVWNHQPDTIYMVFMVLTIDIYG